MNDNLKLEVLKALKKIKDIGPSESEFGICNSLNDYINSDDEDGVDSILNSIFSKWTGFSGSFDYPVPTQPCYPSPRMIQKKIFGLANMALFVWLCWTFLSRPWKES